MKTSFFYLVTLLTFLFKISFNAEFNKLIKTVGHWARCFCTKKWCWTLANNFDFIWIFSYSYLSSP